MPVYEYRCPRGHANEKFFPMEAKRPRTIKCLECGRRATRVFAPAAVRPDFPEHYNWSMGCIVKNRKHHEQLQKERGLQDWEPVKESPQLSKLRREGYL